MWYTYATTCDMLSTYTSTPYILQFLLKVSFGLLYNISLGIGIIIPDLDNIGKKPSGIQ